MNADPVRRPIGRRRPFLSGASGHLARGTVAAALAIHPNPPAGAAQAGSPQNCYQRPPATQALVRAACETQAMEAPAPTADFGFSVEDAVARALAANPTVAEARERVAAARHDRDQATRLPNPVLGATTEDIGLSDHFRRDIGDTESTLSLTQRLELGGDRGARTRAAQAALRREQRACEMAAIEVLARVRQSYLAVQIDTELVALAQASVDLADRLAAAARARVAAGDVSPLERTRAEVVAAEAAIEETIARQDLANSRLALAALWDATELFDQRTEPVAAPVDPAPLAELTALLESGPAAQWWGQERRRARAELELEEARGVPDLNVSAGYRWFHDSRESALVVGLSMPLPVFDQRRDASLGARARIRGVAARTDAGMLDLRTRLAKAHTSARAAAEEARVATRLIVPGARKAAEATEEGYALGEFGLVEVLDARRAWLAADRRRLDALARHHRDRIEIDRILGRPTGESAVEETP